MVLPGDLAAVTFAVSVRPLVPARCGFLFELHIRVETIAAPCAFQPCSRYGAHCREQCDGWDGANFLRFACRIPGDVDYPASTHSGLGTGIEPSMHLIVSCRLPILAGFLQLVELD